MSNDIAKNSEITVFNDQMEELVTRTELVDTLKTFRDFIQEGFQRIDERFQRIDERFQQMEEHFDQRFKKIDERLENIEQHVGLNPDAHTHPEQQTFK